MTSQDSTFTPESEYRRLRAIAEADFAAELDLLCRLRSEAASNDLDFLLDLGRSIGAFMHGALTGYAAFLTWRGTPEPDGSRELARFADDLEAETQRAKWLPALESQEIYGPSVRMPDGGEYGIEDHWRAVCAGPFGEARQEALRLLLEADPVTAWDEYVAGLEEMFGAAETEEGGAGAAVLADPATEGRRERLAAFLAAASAHLGRKVTQADFYRAAGYADQSLLMRWLRGAPNCSKSAAENFERVLRTGPERLRVTSK